MSETEEYKVVDELRPGLRGINVKVRCVSKNEEREVIARRTGETLRVTEALVGDETGSILLTLWNDDIDKMQESQNYTLNNAYTTVFKSSLRLNIGKYGSMEDLEEDSPAEANEENNLSDKVYEQQQRYRPRYGGGGGGGYGGRKSYRDDRSGYRGRGQRRRY
ncbi:MAG: single-stranded DNA-binding protein [Candidatus Helarchaeota archaeon]|nr:single-stranded DNA-binding protein [Candidatus Helarchaeota archaeon]